MAFRESEIGDRTTLFGRLIVRMRTTCLCCVLGVISRVLVFDRLIS